MAEDHYPPSLSSTPLPLEIASLERLLSNMPGPEFLNRVYSREVVARIAGTHGFEHERNELADALREAGYLYMVKGPVGAPSRQESTQDAERWTTIASLARQLEAESYALGKVFSDGLTHDFVNRGRIKGVVRSTFSDEWRDLKNDYLSALFVRSVLRVLDQRAKERVTSSNLPK